MNGAMRGGLGPALAISGSACFWGLYWVPVRALEDLGATGLWAVVFFNIPAFILAAAVYYWRRPDLGEAGRLVMLAGALAGLGLSFYAMGLVLTTVVRATLLFYLTPVWGTLIGIMLLGERPRITRWIALALGLGGLALTLGLSPADLSLNFGLGEALGLLSGLLWAAAAAVTRRLRDAPSVALVHFQFVATMVSAVAMALILGFAAPTAEGALRALTSWPMIPSVIIFASLYLIFWGIARMSPGRSGLLMMTEVVVAVFSAALFLPEEALSLFEWLGAGLIISAGVVEVAFGGDDEAAA